MFVKNLLTPGQYVCPVPVGLPATIQYDAKGHIQKIYQGYHHNLDITDKMLPRILGEDLVPRTINVKNGTTYVSGVFYNSVRYNEDGTIPDCICSKIIDDFSNEIHNLNFFAGTLDSLAVQFRGAHAIQRWLVSSGFNCLKGFIVPYNIDEKIYKICLQTCGFNFVYPLIMDYLIYDDGVGHYHHIDLHQDVVKSKTRIIDEDGYVCCDLIYQSGLTSREPYSEIVSHQIVEGSVVFLYNNKIQYVYNSDHTPVSTELTCPYCGRVYNSPLSGSVRCPDTHCISRRYGSVRHFLSSLEVPYPTKKQYDNFVKPIGNAFVLADIFDMEELSSMSVRTTLDKFLYSVVPVNVFRSYDDIRILVNRCNNSWSSLKYYIHHPNLILTDLCSDCSQNYVAFVTWLSDVTNSMDIVSCGSSQHINIVSQNRLFEGAPALRNKTIYLTGVFRHGDFSEVSSILASYGGTCIDTYTANKVDYVIIGDMHEDINGFSVDKLKDRGVPVYSESDFFDKYGIDYDIVKNLE